MKQIFKSCVLMIIVHCMIHECQAQKEQQGINFINNKSWNEIRTIAKKANKYIFLDFYTTWCGPCREMDREIFPLAKVGEYVNKHFVSAKIQADITSKDNSNIKKWHKDARLLKEKYGVVVYPTYIFLDPSGNIVHRYAGSTNTGDEFINIASITMDKEHQYYSLVKELDNGRKDSLFLRTLMAKAGKAGDNDLYEKAAGIYVQNLVMPFQQDNLEYFYRIASYIRKIDHPSFKFLVDNQQRVEQLLGKGKIDTLITTVVYFDIIAKDDFYKNEPDWNKLSEQLSLTYPNQSDQLQMLVTSLKSGYFNSRIGYYIQKKDWKNFQSNLIAFTEKFKANGEQGETTYLNGWAWDAFLHIEDRKTLEAAQFLSKASFKNDSTCQLIGCRDTYANLLYKLYKLHKVGSLAEPIKWEEQAAQCAANANMKEEEEVYKDRINRMKKKENTWENVE